MSASVLSVRDLTIKAHLDSGERTLLDTVSLDLAKEKSSALSAKAAPARACSAAR